MMLARALRPWRRLDNPAASIFLLRHGTRAAYSAGPQSSTADASSSQVKPAPGAPSFDTQKTGEWLDKSAPTANAPLPQAGSPKAGSDPLSAKPQPKRPDHAPSGNNDATTPAAAFVRTLPALNYFDLRATSVHNPPARPARPADSVTLSRTTYRRCLLSGELLRGITLSPVGPAAGASSTKGSAPGTGRTNATARQCVCNSRRSSGYLLDQTTTPICPQCQFYGSIRSLSINGAQISPSFLGFLLRTFSMVDQLHLFSVPFTLEHLNELQMALQGRPRLNSLTLHNCSIGENLVSVLLRSDLLRHTSYIDLSHNNFGIAGSMNLLARQLATGQLQARILDISGNHLNHREAAILFGALHANTSLLALRMRNMKTPNVDVRVPLADLFMSASRLAELDMKGTPLLNEDRHARVAGFWAKAKQGLPNFSQLRLGHIPTNRIFETTGVFVPTSSKPIQPNLESIRNLRQAACVPCHTVERSPFRNLQMQLSPYMRERMALHPDIDARFNVTALHTQSGPLPARLAGGRMSTLLTAAQRYFGPHTHAESFAETSTCRWEQNLRNFAQRRPELTDPRPTAHLPTLKPLAAMLRAGRASSAIPRQREHPDLPPIFMESCPDASRPLLAALQLPASALSHIPNARISSCHLGRVLVGHVVVSYMSIAELVSLPLQALFAQCMDTLAALSRLETPVSDHMMALVRAFDPTASLTALELDPTIRLAVFSACFRLFVSLPAICHAEEILSLESTSEGLATLAASVSSRTYGLAQAEERASSTAGPSTTVAPIPRRAFAEIRRAALARARLRRRDEGPQWSVSAMQMTDNGSWSRHLRQQLTQARTTVELLGQYIGRDPVEVAALAARQTAAWTSREVAVWLAKLRPSRQSWRPHSSQGLMHQLLCPAPEWADRPRGYLNAEPIMADAHQWDSPLDGLGLMGLARLLVTPVRSRDQAEDHGPSTELAYPWTPEAQARSNLTEHREPWQQHGRSMAMGVMSSDPRPPCLTVTDEQIDQHIQQLLNTLPAERTVLRQHLGDLLQAATQTQGAGAWLPLPENGLAWYMNMPITKDMSMQAATAGLLGGLRASDASGAWTSAEEDMSVGGWGSGAGMEPWVSSRQRLAGAPFAFHEWRLSTPKEQEDPATRQPPLATLTPASFPTSGLLLEDLM
ncbi:hypothetical protein H696_02459 [Fonticula alba]|uniref:Uncharacterized protein n=1 Tax=Fonticula alba TaxID=691883 RepID=A0A058ZAR9_FONAL|nr:hypothetical protein H696_02459 [Fonticula alba]KCV71515.1 hypothetical protein H696_02459 [Fonticula alba]|eukprot:XP_009494638.1 hypothetical protein H696_02459 [Fonticula alba]